MEKKIFTEIWWSPKFVITLYPQIKYKLQTTNHFTTLYTMIKKLQKTMKALIVLVFLSYSTTTIKAQLSVSNTLTPAQLIQQVLLGTGVTVSNIVYTGDTGAIGQFNGSTSNIGFAGGVLMTTGKIWNAPGPNNNCCQGSCNNTNGDAQLTAICGQTTHDACIIDFDFVPTSDTVKFRYVFASEEYPEYVGTIFNDVFAFFISGPGITGTPNIALVPNTSTPVSIGTINNGNYYCPNAATGPCMNCAYYIDNCTGTTVEYDAFTTQLTAKHWVTPCLTYHIKLAIADAGDCVFDSGVFLEAGSFTGGSVTVHSNIHNTNTTVDTMAVEGCTNGAFVFTLPQAQSIATVIHFQVQGTATNGVDYPFIPDSIVIAAGQTADSIIISPYFDGISEPIESVVLNIQNVTLCTSSNDSISLWIRNVDAIQLVATPIGDTTVCPNIPVPLLGTATGGYGHYTYAWDNGASTDSAVTVSPSATTTYTLTITDICGNTAIGSVTVIVTSPESIASFNNSVTEGCGTATVVFSLNVIQTTPTLITYDVTGTATNGIDYPMLPGMVTIPANQASTNITIAPYFDGVNEPTETIILTLTNTCLPSTTTITILDEPSIVPNITGYDICAGQSTQLIVRAIGGTGPLTYTWSDNLGDSTVVNPSPSSTQTYSVAVTDTCHVQTGRDSITIYVFPLPIAHFGFNYLEPNNVNLINLSTGATTYFWTFGDGELSRSDQHSFDHLFPEGPGSYFITLVAYNSEGCPDSNTARVTFTEDYSIFVPTSFHPGWDLNPGFGAYSNAITEYSMTVFNRWGELLFETTDVSNQWLGTTPDGNLMKQDTYVWVMKAILKNGKKVERNGTVFLIR